MKFVKINHEVLRSLKDQGYNVLTSVNHVDDEEPTYMPHKVDDLWEYLDSIPAVPLEEQALIVIDDVLSVDGDIPGMVWVSDENSRKET